MGWRNWPYWVKGGIISFIMSSILYVLLGYFLILQEASYTPLCSDNIILELLCGYYLSFFMIPVVPIFTLVGIVIGWIYGKVKNRA